MVAFSLLLSVCACVWVYALVLFDLLFNRKWNAADLFTKSQLCPLPSVLPSFLQTHLVSNLLPTLKLHDDFINLLFLAFKNDSHCTRLYLNLITYFAL